MESFSVEQDIHGRRLNIIIQSKPQINRTQGDSVIYDSAENTTETKISIHVGIQTAKVFRTRRLYVLYDYDMAMFTW